MTPDGQPPIPDAMASRGGFLQQVWGSSTDLPTPGGEREAHELAARVHLHWLVDEVADLGERLDRRDAGAGWAEVLAPLVARMTAARAIDKKRTETVSACHHASVRTREYCGSVMLPRCVHP